MKRGERVRLVVTDSGKVLHELVLDELKKHGELIKKRMRGMPSFMSRRSVPCARFRSAGRPTGVSSAFA